VVATVSSWNLKEVGFNVKKVIFLISVSPFFISKIIPAQMLTYGGKRKGRICHIHGGLLFDFGE